MVNNMAESRMVEVAEELLRRSEAGDLSWEAPFTSNFYTVNLQDISLVIFNPGRDEYLLTLRDYVGKEIESYHAEPGTAGFQTLAQLFEVARRQALDVEGNIDKALEYLKGS